MASCSQLTFQGYDYTLEIWDGTTEVMVDSLTNSKIAIDTETELVIGGQPVVPVIQQVCSQYLRAIQVIPWNLMDVYNERLFALNPNTQFLMHNAPFDLRVLGLRQPGKDYLLEAVQDGRIVDTAIRYILYKLACGMQGDAWGLKAAAWDMCQIPLVKDDATRQGFKQSDSLSDEQIRYAVLDSVATARLGEALSKPFPTEELQLKGFIAASHAGVNGMLVDREEMARLTAGYQERVERTRVVLAMFGYHPKAPGNQKVLQGLLTNIESRLPRLTGHADKFERTPKSGAIKITSESLAILGSHDHPFIDALKEHDHARKMVKTYLNPDLIHPDGRMHPFVTPLVRTGRMSFSKPNLQNLPREEGVRGMYVASPGTLYYSCDYGQLELCALAQTCLNRYGYSAMADILNSGVDLHRWFAAKVAGCSEDSITKDQRQMAKACNFGFPGGMGIRTFQRSARKGYGVDLSLDECSELKKTWLAAFPEMSDHLAPAVDSYSRKDDEEGREWYIASTITGRVRRGATYCAACNYPFQGLAADGGREALWEMYLRDFFTVNFVHDETISEVPDTPDVGDYTRSIDSWMLYGMKAVIKDVTVTVEGALTRRWYKEAEPVFNKAGDLIVWEPQQKQEIVGA